jgi:hypothetical protein
MSRPSGFMPVPFHLAGKILVVIAAIVFAIYLLSIVFQLYTLPMLVLAIDAAVMLIGLYLIFVIPKEETDSN